MAVRLTFQFDAGIQIFTLSCDMSCHDGWEPLGQPSWVGHYGPNGFTAHLKPSRSGDDHRSPIESWLFST